MFINVAVIALGVYVTYNAINLTQKIINDFRNLKPNKLEMLYKIHKINTASSTNNETIKPKIIILPTDTTSEAIRKKWGSQNNKTNKAK